MSEQPPLLPGQAGPLRTLAVRMSDDLRAQLDVIAQLNDRTVTEEIRLALEFWIDRSKNDPSVLARAETVRAEIEREAQTKRDAIAAGRRRVRDAGVRRGGPGDRAPAGHRAQADRLRALLPHRTRAGRLGQLPGHR